MKNIYVKKYIKRGLIFSGFGPIIAGIVNLILSESGVIVNLSAKDFFLSVVSTYIIAFVQAGSSIFPQIESWSKVKAMGLQFISLYTVYTLGYLINGWIPLNWIIILIYTLIFIVVFLIIWLIAFLTSRNDSNSLNKKLEEIKSTLE